MGYPQITLIALWAVALGIVAAKNGTPQSNHSIGMSLFGTSVTASVLYWGGFWQ